MNYEWCSKCGVRVRDGEGHTCPVASSPSDATPRGTPPMDAEKLRTLILAATEELGRYGLSASPDAIAALSSLVVNASRLGSLVGAAPSEMPYNADDVRKLEATARSFVDDRPTAAKYLRDLANRLAATLPEASKVKRSSEASALSPSIENE